MPTKNLTSVVSLILTVALVWSSLGAGIISTPVQADLGDIVEDNLPTETASTETVNIPANEKPNLNSVLGEDAEETTSYGGWNYDPASAPENWSFRDAHNVPETGYTGDGITVAVADTGIDFGTTNLAGKYMTVEDPDSAYFGWPVAFDAYGLPEYLMAKEAIPDIGGIANTTLNGTGPFEVDHTIKVDGQNDFSRNEQIGLDRPSDIKVAGTPNYLDFDLTELLTTRDSTYWYSGLRTHYGAINRTFGFAYDFDGPASGSTTDPKGNLLDFKASHSAPIEQVSYSAAKGLIASCAAKGSGDAITDSKDINSVKIWDENGNLVRSLPNEPQPVFSTVWSPNGNFLAYETGLDVVIYNTNAWTEAYRITHSAAAVGTYYRESMAFSPNSTMLAVGSIEASNKIQILNVLTGETARPNVPTTTTSVAYSPDGWNIALGQANGRVQLLNSTTYKLTALLENEDGRAIETIAWEPNNDYIATGRSTSGNIEIWDLNAGNNSYQWGNGYSVIEGITINDTADVRINELDRFFFRGIPNELNVNGLTSYQLAVPATGNSDSLKYSTLMPNAQNFTWGMRVWLRDSSGVETELTSGAEAIVYRDMDGSGTQIGYWTPPSTVLGATDSLVIRIYQGTTAVPTGLVATFTTAQFGTIDTNIMTLYGSEWRVNYQTRKNTASVDTVMTGGHAVSSTVNTIKWTDTQIISGSDDGKIVVWNPTTYIPTTAGNSLYNSPILSFDMKSTGDMFVGTSDCSVRKYPTGWGTAVPFASHKPDVMVYIKYVKEDYIATSSGFKLSNESYIETPELYKWNPSTMHWDEYNITNIWGDYFYKGTSAGEWTAFGYIELALPRNFTAWPDQNFVYSSAFVCGDNVSQPIDTVPMDCNVPSPTVENWVNWGNMHTTSISAWGLSQIPEVKVTHSDIVSVRALDNRSYHFGYHPSEALTNLFGSAVPMILTESTTLGIWDRVYADMNGDYIIDANDPYVDKSNPVLTIDIWNYNTTTKATVAGQDGIPDISGGLLYFIGNGVDLMPYSQRVSDLLLENGRLLSPFGTEENPWNIPKNGEMVAFFGDMDYDDAEGKVLTTGTQMASAIAGSGLNIGTFAPILGVSPDITFLPICNAHKDLTMALNFAIDGYDGQPNTGDEAQIVAIGPYTTGYGSGLDTDTQTIEYLVNKTDSNVVFISPAGNDGSGYGTVAAPCGLNTLVVGFAEDNNFVAGGGETHHYGDVSELSSRGPTAAGLAKPDVIAIGLGEVDLPLSTAGSVQTAVGGKSQSVLWKGSELATAVTTGVMALIFEAYHANYGYYPSTQVAMDIIRSSAKDLGHDPMTQGSGFVDALAAVRIAEGESGLLLSAPKTSFGNTFGASYDSFINVLAPGETSTLPVSVHNPNDTSAISANYGFEYMSRTGSSEMYRTVDSANGYRGDISTMFPANAEVIKVTAQTNLTWTETFNNVTDSKSFYTEGASFFMRLWDWEDAQPAGDANHGIIDTNDGLSYLTGVEHGYVNSMICTLSNPHGNLKGKLVLDITPDVAAGSGMKSRPWKIMVESFTSSDMDWMTLSSTNSNIPVGGTDTVNLGVSVPTDALGGTYTGSFVTSYDPLSGSMTQTVPYTSLAEAEYLNTSLYTTSWDDGMVGNYWDGDTTTPYPIEVGKYDNFPQTNPLETYSVVRVAHSPITITGNSGFGAVAARGSGTVSDPWIIENLDIDGSTYSQPGISISDTDDYFVIQNCAVHDTVDNSGISFSNVTNGVVVNSESYMNTVNGIAIVGSSNILVDKVSLHNSSGYGNGVYIEASSNITVSEADITTNYITGVYLYMSTEIEVVGCNIHEQTPDSGFSLGLFLEYSDNCLITGNSFYNDFWGILVSASNDNSILSNVFDGFDWQGLGENSIYMDSSYDSYADPSQNNVISGNNFLSCTAGHAFDDDPSATNDWDGNHWAEYTDVDTTPADGVWDNAYFGIDVDWDGIGDLADSTPYVNPVATAQTRYTAHAPITIIGDANFTLANGVVAGNGSVDNPYIISGWEIDATGQTHGIKVEMTSANFVIRDCLVYGDGVADGIVLNSAYNSVVLLNELHDLEIAISVAGPNNFIVMLNTISDSTIGIAVTGIADGGDVMFNTIDSCAGGIYILNMINTSVEGNQVSACSLYGIGLMTSDSCMITDNTVSLGTEDGIVATDSDNILITYNNLESNGYGIRLANSTGINALHHNNFIGNTYDAYDDFPGDSLESFEIFSNFGVPADYVSVYDVKTCTVTRNMVPLTEGVDYDVDQFTGLITFLNTQYGQAGGAVISIKAVLIYEETVTIIKLPNTRLIDGSAEVFINVTGLDGSINTLIESRYTVNYKTGTINLTLPLSIELGIDIHVTYNYYNRTGIVPITLNVATAESGNFAFGNLNATGETSIMPVWGIRAGQGAVKESGDRLVSGDRRYFYVSVPNQGMFTVSELANFYLYSELWWDLNQTDLNIVIYGKGPTASYVKAAPYSMTKLGGSEEKADFTPFTATGGPKDVLVTNFNHETLVICVSAKAFNGANDPVTKFEGKSGWLRMSDNNPKAWTNDVVGHMSVSSQSSIEMDGISASIVGPAQGVKSVEGIYQDDLTLYDLSTLEGWLTMNAVAGFSKVVTVENALSWDVHIMGHPECVDLDLALFYDGKAGQPKDGVAQWREIITTKDMQFDAYKDNYGSGSYCYCADADADEAIKIISPWDGDYIIKVLGYTVTTEPGYFDLEIKSIFAGVEGYKLTHADTDYEDKDATSSGYVNFEDVPGYQTRTFDILWTFPEGTEDNVYGGIFVLGTPLSPKLIVIAIDINLDREAPGVFPGNTGPNTIVSTKLPTISAKIEDLAKGEIDPEGSRVEFDGVDITDIAQISIGITENAAEVEGYWTGDIIYRPTTPLTEGGHNMFVEIKDKAGNVNYTSWAFTVDTTEPVLMLDNNDDNIYTSSPVYRLSGTSEPNSVISVIGVRSTVAQRLDNTFDIDLRLEEDDNFITIRSIDLAGNTYEATKTITLDTEAPEFVRVVALDGSVTNRRMTGIYGEMTEAGTLELNGDPVLVNSDGTFRQEAIALAEGRNMQVLKFTDMAGNIATSYLNITLDTLAPELTIDDTESVVYTESVNISGTTESDVATLTVNGDLKEISPDGKYIGSVRLSPGINTIVIESKDQAGNSMVKTITIRYATEEAETNYAAIGTIFGMLVLGLIIGILLAYIIFGGRKEDAEEIPKEDLAEAEMPMEEDIEPIAEEVPVETEDIPAEDEMPSEPESADEPEIQAEVEPIEEATEVSENEALEPIPAAEASPEEIPPESAPEDPRIVKLKEAYESGKISKELYEKNLARFKEQ